MPEEIKQFLNIAESVSSAATGDIIIGSPVLLHYNHPILNFEFEPGGLNGETIDKFECQTKAYAGGAWISQFTTWPANGASGDIIYSSHALQGIAGDIKAMAIVRVGPIYAVRFLTSWAPTPAAARTSKVTGAATRWI